MAEVEGLLTGVVGGANRPRSLAHSRALVSRS